jgi:hypothetical protein
MPDEITRLREENRRLRDVLARHGIELPSSPKREPEAEPPTATLSNDQKVTLFRALFAAAKTCTLSVGKAPTVEAAIPKIGT